MQAIAWTDGKIILLDQTELPLEEVYLELDDYRQVAEAIRALRVRGAPLIGIAAAYGLVLAAREIEATDRESFAARLRAAADELAATRPTAVNLAWALRRLLLAAEAAPDVEAAKVALLDEARRIHVEDVEANRRMGEHGAELLPPDAVVLTHCNTGSLATAGYGTALGVIRAAREQGKLRHVYATETRPLLQGARLTAWELQHDGIPATLIADGAAGSLIQRGLIACVIVGADRIARNGDTANKIGTYMLAVLAKENGIPFYVAAPTSTVDLSLASGDDIPIEERSPDEVTDVLGRLRVAPPGIAAANPAFDVTPSRYISAIVTEAGVARAPYTESLAALCNGSHRRELT